VTAIVRLETRDVFTEPQVMIRLGQDHVPVPSPFDRLFAQLLAQSTAHCASQPRERWLSPGRIPGHAVSAQALRVRLFESGSKPALGCRSGQPRMALLLPSSPNCPLRWLSKRSGSMRAPPTGGHHRLAQDGTDTPAAQ
jgi:hypothetical protein